MTRKILHVLHHSLPSPLDGYAIRSHAILRAQKQAGMNVLALTGSHQPAYPDEQATIDGVRYLRTPSGLRFEVFGYVQASRYRALQRRLAGVLKSERPDLIHVHSPAYNGLAAVGVARRAGIPVVYEVRATWEDAAVDKRILGARSLLYRAVVGLETHVFKQADAVVTICNGLKDEVLRRGVNSRKVFVAPSGVQTDSLHPAPPDLELARKLGLKDGLVIAFIGSLFLYEGVEDLLDVIPAVLSREPNVNFLIVGGGERKAQVMARVEQFRATGRVIYVPRVPHDEVRAYYTLADCMVYPRHSVRLTELVTPLKPLEAMAMQKIVIASDIGGHRELIADGQTGMLYPAGEAAALTEVLCRVIADPGLRNRISSTARKYVVENRRWDGLVSNHLAAYDFAYAAHGLPGVESPYFQESRLASRMKAKG